MTLTASTISKIAGVAVNDNMLSVLAGLQYGGAKYGLDQRHRLAHYLGQLSHESEGFIYDREIWGPTPAQRGYEGRADLGNTQPGDGKKFAGHGPIQVTGRYNHRVFRDWCRKHIDPNCPDFEKYPELINTDPWEGLTGIWYWSTRDLNRDADANDLRAITRRINGGYNGLADRYRRYDRAALVLLGFDPTDVRGFQATRFTNPADIDNISGPNTRAVLHMALKSSRLVDFGESQHSPKPDTSPAPPVLRVGSAGAAVASLQLALSISADGHFGDNTEAAVKGFQLGAGLTVDGIAGQETQAALTTITAAKGTANV